MNELDALTRVALSQPLSAGSFTSQLQSERGFHLTSTTDIIFSQSSGGCKLHALFLFPSDVFVDRYELGQRRQDGVLGSEFEVWGETDLELPVQAVNRRGSALLISLSANQSTLEVPFHLRYLEPTTVNPGLKESLFGSYRTLKSPWPFIYEACSSGKENLFPTLSAVGPASIIESAASLRFAQPSPATLTGYPSYRIIAPVGDMSHASFIEFGTVIVTCGAFLYVALGAIRLFRAPSKGIAQPQTKHD